VASITDDDVKTELRKIIDEHGKTSAIRAKANLSAFFVWALKEGIAKINPVVNTHSISENPPRHRVLEDHEIKAIWSASQDDDFGRIVKLLFLTACRRDEIGGLRWSELNLDTGVMTIPGARTKAVREHKLILPPLAVKLLQNAPHRKDREFVFGIRGGAFSRWSYEKLALEKRLMEAGHRLPQFGLHDIRRTVRTGMGKLGIKPHIAELVLNHVGHKAGIGGTYDWHTYAPEIREALETWAKHLETIIKDPDSNVTPIRRMA
jgi:integrase